MKKMIMCGLTAVLSVLSSCGSPEGIDPVTQYWGKVNRELIRRAKEVKIYQIAPDAEPLLIKDLSLDDLALLKNKLDESSTYLFEVQKKTPFFPDRAVDLIDGNQKLTILFMRSASLLGFETPQEIKVEDYDGAESIINQILQ